MTPPTPQGSQDGLICDECHADAQEGDTACWNCGHTTFVYEPGNRRTEHNADSPDTKSSPASLPKATPEQLREAIRQSIYMNIPVAVSQDVDEVLPEIMQAVATFLASIELPRKQHKYKVPNQHEAGYNEALGQSQAIIDKLIKELRG